LTEENKKRNIKEELEAAEKTRSEAELLFQNGFFNGAVSRLYYSLLYRIRALLLTKGLEPKSHEGALRLLSLHFVKEGNLETKASHLFSKLMKYREEADYNPAYVFTREDFVNLRAETDDLAEKIRIYINEKHYL
jgi:uncharacterized protein (UPF0332 family)